MTTPEHGLKFVPITLFAMIMGLSGVTLATEKAENTLQWSVHPSHWLMWLTAALFAVFTILYGLKTLRYPAQSKKDFNHPIRINFFPTFSISLLLLSALFNTDYHGFAYGLWLTGAVVHLLFSLVIMSAWMHNEKFQIQHLNPAWLIPVVGNIIVPLTGVKFAVATEVLWFYFSVGLFFGLVLMTLFFNRIFFHPPMPIKLLPTLFILLAPPAIGFISYVKLTGEVDIFARLLYYAGLFIFLLLAVQVRIFIKIPFFMSWWAYSFPLAALTLASFLMAAKTQIGLIQYLALGLYGLLSILIIMLLVNTAKAALTQKICVNEDN